VANRWVLERHGQVLRITYRHPVSTDRLRLLQAVGGVRNRSISRITVAFDGGAPIPFDLDAASRPDKPAADGTAGQVITFGHRRFTRVDITIAHTDPGRLRRYDGVSAVGFAEVTAVDDNGTRPVAHNIVRLPVDLLQVAGKHRWTVPSPWCSPAAGGRHRRRALRPRTLDRADLHPARSAVVRAVGPGAPVDASGGGQRIDAALGIVGPTRAA